MWRFLSISSHQYISKYFDEKTIPDKTTLKQKLIKQALLISVIYNFQSTDDQKLIYSGKLLSDTVVLKDVLRRYDGQEAHTVHLVFTPKLNAKISSKSMSMSSEGLRQRANAPVRQSESTTEVPSSATPSQQTVQQNAAGTSAQTSTNSQNIPNNISNINNVYTQMSSGSGNPHEYFLAQQFAMQAWMQQAYSQYLNQYMNV